MEEVFQAFESQIESFALVPGAGGAFEFTVNDHLLYSKLATGQHTFQGQIVGLLRDYLQEAA